MWPPDVIDMSIFWLHTCLLIVTPILVTISAQKNVIWRLPKNAVNMDKLNYKGGQRPHKNQNFSHTVAYFIILAQNHSFDHGNTENWPPTSYKEKYSQSKVGAGPFGQNRLYAKIRHILHPSSFCVACIFTKLTPVV